MKFYADLHLHSKYSRATSRDMTPENLWRWAQIKGITVIGTGDCTHPRWLAELREKLAPDGNGLFRLRKKFQPDDIPQLCRADVRFMLTAEICTIFKRDDRTRKVHSVVLVPSINEAEKINRALSAIGNLAADGRPILKLDVKELLELVLDNSPRSVLIPAHAWTPHFSVFGANSGFNSIDECFGELSPHINAIETGLSSDPPMNWLVRGLDGVTLVSNSDAHSPANIGREANVFYTGVTYRHITDAIRTGKGFAGTLEFYPEAGKYHLDGHRACGVCLAPEETERCGRRCPKCGKKITVGVLNRVNEVAERPEGFRPDRASDFRYLVPLMDIISDTLGKGKNTKTVGRLYTQMVENLGNEFGILMDVPLGMIGRNGSEVLLRPIRSLREGLVDVTAGYDGVYGSVKLMGGD